MDRRNFYFKQNLTEGNMDELEDLIERAIGNAVNDAMAQVANKWAKVARPEQTTSPSMNILVKPNAVWVKENPDYTRSVRIGIIADQTVNCAVDHSAVSTVPSAGNTRFISVFAKFVRNEYDTKVDGYGNPVNYKVDESYVLEVWAGTQTTGTPVRVTKPGNEYALCCEVLLNENCGSTGISTPSDYDAPGQNQIDVTQLSYNGIVLSGGSRGSLQGSLLYRDTSNPPYITIGDYEVGGTVVKVKANKSSQTNGYIGDQTPRANTWYYVMMNAAGLPRLQIAEGAYVRTYPINSISGGNTINFTGDSGGTQPLATMIAAIEGAETSGNNGFWAITSVTGAPVTSITIPGSLTNQAGVQGTIKFYYKMSTFHFGVSGAEVHVTAAASVKYFTPSPADALFANPVIRDWACFDPNKNGYYSKWPGHTGYRILGCVLYGNSSTFDDVVSYKSGRNKNDNWIYSNNFASGAEITGNHWMRFDNVQTDSNRQLWGNDYLLTDDATYGGQIKLLRPGNSSIVFDIYLHMLSSTTASLSQGVFIHTYNATRSGSYEIMRDPLFDFSTVAGLAAYPQLSENATIRTDGFRRAIMVLFRNASSSLTDAPAVRYLQFLFDIS